MTTQSTPEPGWVPLLQRVFDGMPRLDRPACAGAHELFDPAEAYEDLEAVASRHQRAAALCGRCPALANCRTWVDDLQVPRRPAGVVGGRIPQRRPPGRPPSHDAARTRAPHVDDREAAR